MQGLSSYLASALTGTVVVLAVVVSAASPAGAHAVLVRTEPSAQTTVPAAPPAVRLKFSESVETAFGAVRVFDVDGKRVDEGRLSAPKGGREVLVPADLTSGTYTVIWRVVSTDGHASRGAFQFYIVAPSTISPVPVGPDAGTATLTGWGYGAVRFTWYAALGAMVGLVVIRRFVWAPALAAAGLRLSGAAVHFERWFIRALPLAWAGLLAAWLGRIVFQTASIAGLGVAESARPDVLGAALATSFGRSWLAGLGFTLLAGVAVRGLTQRRVLFRASPETWFSVLVAGAVGVALALANMGHARTEGNPALGVPSSALHLLAVSVWVGGLVTLVAVGARAWSALPPGERNPLVSQLVARFSRLAAGAVAVLVATGVLNAVLDLASVSDLWRTPYGRVLAAKISLLVVALGFGAWHLRVAPQRLATTDPAGAASRAFRRSSALELVLLTAVVGLSSALVALVPGRSLAELDRGPVTEERRLGPYTVQLFIDPTAPGRNQIHLTFVDANGLGASEVTSVAAFLGEGPLTPLSLRLLAVGHFVADSELAPGAHRLRVSLTSTPGAPSTTFSFDVRGDAAPQEGR